MPFLNNLVRTTGVQEVDEVDIYVSISIVISKAVKKEEWGSCMRSLGNVRTEM